MDASIKNHKNVKLALSSSTSTGAIDTTMTTTTTSNAESGGTNVDCGGKNLKECDTIKKREDLTSLGSDDSGK